MQDYIKSLLDLRVFILALALTAVFVAFSPPAVAAPQTDTGGSNVGGTGNQYNTSDSAFRLFWDPATDEWGIDGAAPGTAGNNITWPTIHALTVNTSNQSLFQVGNDAGSCTAAKLGRLRYNGTSTWEYCNGSAWSPFESAGCVGPAGCTAVGNVCSDGTVFAGCGGTDYHPFFVTRCDAGQTWDGNCDNTPTARVTHYWSDTSSATNLRATGVTGWSDGQANTAALTNGVANGTGDAKTTAGVQPHNAAQYCANLDLNGHQDWYLPAIAELYTMGLHQAAIGNFVSDIFKSSSEYDNTIAMTMNFSNGAVYNGSSGDKINLDYVRCARRD